MKIFANLLVSLVCGLACTLASAVCVDLSNTTNWSNINTHKIIMYQGSKAIAVLDIPSCDIYPSTTIRLDKANVYTGDDIIGAGIAFQMRNIENP